jgi:HAD superfamily hydrolase (TIGR01549 family)
LIKGVIFGLDGTLLKFTGNWDYVLNEGAEATADWYYTKKHLQLDRAGLTAAILAEHRKAVEQSQATLRQTVMADVLRTALKQVEASSRAEPLVEEALRAFYTPQETAYQTINDGVSVLKSLREEGLKVGILANALDNTLVQRLVNTYSLRPWVAPVFSSAGLGWRKPQPQGFTLIAERWQLTPAEIVVVGDGLMTDILGGKNAGMRTILVALSANPADPGPSPIRAEQTIHTLSQLPLAIAAMNAKVAH